MVATSSVYLGYEFIFDCTHVAQFAGSVTSWVHYHSSAADLFTPYLLSSRKRTTGSQAQWRPRAASMGAWTEPRAQCWKM